MPAVWRWWRHDTFSHVRCIQKAPAKCYILVQTDRKWNDVLQLTELTNHRRFICSLAMPRKFATYLLMEFRALPKITLGEWTSLHLIMLVINANQSRGMETSWASSTLNVPTLWARLMTKHPPLLLFPVLTPIYPLLVRQKVFPLSVDSMALEMQNEPLN